MRGTNVSTEKPLHVRMAEALGQEIVFVAGEHGSVGTWGVVHREFLVDMRTFPPGPRRRWFVAHDGDIMAEVRAVPRFDTDWIATGPLIEKYGIMVHADTKTAASKQIRAKYEEDGEDREGPIWFNGKTTLEAVCAVILVLGEEGLLNV